MTRLREERGSVGVTLAVVGGIIALVILVFGIRWITAEPSGALEAREQTIGDGSYRISAYDQFYDDCSSAKTLQANLETAKQQLADFEAQLGGQSTGGPSDLNRLAQLRANVTALTNQLNEAVNQYNADARKADTRGHFRASDLPYELDTEGTISCTA